jgi:hypothetical protein
MPPYTFNLGLERAHYTDHNGDKFERKQTAEEKEIIDALIAAVGPIKRKEAWRKRQQYEEAAALRMRDIGVEEQHRLKRENLK